MKGIPKHEWPADLGDESHDLQELALNTDFETGELKGSWGNLGYWYNEQGDPLHGYSDAAQQLAHALGKFANLSSNQTVLDLGHSLASSLLRVLCLWCEFVEDSNRVCAEKNASMGHCRKCSS